MALTIPTKDAKRQSLLVDGLRILAFQSWKIEEGRVLEDSLKSQGAYSYLDEVYSVFLAEFKKLEIHQFTFAELSKYITEDLGYTLNDILQIRSEYYNKRKNSATPRQTQSQAQNDFGNDELF
ncbi:MAG: hypothetical protein MUE44_34755 [Oscillatoriaceae cyanobacterium Prado104]|jgi:hypothetical protein|nr:hypothetical protein [Oscillatoriaceae cyanobacterium Prado104]